MTFFLVFLHTDIMLKSSLVPTSCDLLMFAFWLLCPCCLILTPSPHLRQEFVTGQVPEICAHWLLAFFLCCVWHAHPFDSGATYSCHCVDQLLCHWMLCFLSYEVLCWSSMGQCFKSVTVIEQLSSLWCGCDGMCHQGIPIRVLSIASECEAGSMSFATLHLLPSVCSPSYRQCV